MEVATNNLQLEVDFTIPFEFKEINPSDFLGYETVEKIVIEPDENGFIYSSLRNEFDFAEQNTLVINAAVGQGKSHALNRFAVDYYKLDDNYKVFIVVPFKSLISQYHESLLKLDVPESEIIDYQQLDDYENTNSPTFHLISINTLLGNFGDRAVSQSERKKKYLNELVTYCEENAFKVVFFIDEIHDSIKNFKELFIFNLLKWKDITQKIVVSSATYNETSKIVIKYLSELTNHKIRIIESKRVVNEEKVSNLNLFFIPQVEKFQLKNRRFLNLIEEECEKGRKIDILTYSKSLAEQLVNVNSPVYKILTKFNQTPNLCTSNSKASFNPNLCNIGTNFKTGINIVSEQSSFIIILPPNAYSGDNIFSDGINSIIQALARPRKKSEIFIVMSFPTGLIEPYEQNINYFSITSQIRRSLNESKFKYFSINKQDALLKSFYNKQKKNFIKETSALKTINRKYRPRLEFPPFEIYSLEFAEKYFYTQYEIFGQNLPAYVIWAAFNNQFFNCRFKNYYIPEYTNLKEGKIQIGLDKFFKNRIDPNKPFYELNSDLYCYNHLKQLLFSSKVTYINKKGEKSLITEDTQNRYQRHILSYLQRKRASINWEFRKKFYPNDLIDINGNFNTPVDYEYQIEDYMRASISVSLNNDYLIQNSLDRELVMLYRAFYAFKNLFIEKYLFTDSNEKKFFLIDGRYSNIISNDDYTELCRVIRELKIKDKNLKMFSFFQYFDTTNVDKTKKAVFSFIKKLFFNTEVQRINSIQYPNDRKGYVLIQEIDLGDGSSSLNLIYEPETPWIYQSGHGYEQDIFLEQTLPTTEIEKAVEKRIDEENET